MCWSCDQATGEFQLSWTESHGPAVKPLGRRGFGLRLIERALAGEANARAELSFRPEGLHCQISATLLVTAQPHAA